MIYGVKVRLILCSVTALVTGCADDDRIVPVPTHWETLEQGQIADAGCTEPRDRLIRSDEEWAEYWTLAHPGSAPERPAVDFTVDSVLVTCKQHPSPAEWVEIDNVFWVANGGTALRASVRDNQPGPASGCGATAAVIATTHHAVRVEGVAGSARFRHYTYNYYC